MTEYHEDQYPRPEPPIINASHALPRLVWWCDFVLTIVLWLCYFYLVREALIFVAKSLEWVFFGVRHPELRAFGGLLRTLGVYALVVLVNGGILIGWAFYNQKRFRGKERRLSPKFVTTEDIASTYHVPASDLEQWQKAKILTVHHDAQGNVLRVGNGREAGVSGDQTR